MPTDFDINRVTLTPEELDAMMPAGENVHTFVQSNIGTLIGCDMNRAKILERARERGSTVELSGEVATNLGHGAVILKNGKTPLFVATKPQA